MKQPTNEVSLFLLGLETFFLKDNPSKQMIKFVGSRDIIVKD
jgi:hypothetical protein